MKNRRRIAVPILLLAFLLFITQGQTSQEVEVYIEKASPISPELIQRQTEFARISEIDKHMGLLGIKPGMTILDIGTGSGQLAYKFAKRVRKTGKVFATDISIGLINYITKQAQARNLTNLIPVLVNSEGLDEFYTKNRFDFIFISHTYYHLRDRINYFKKLKDSLTKNGQLVILESKDFKKLSLSDISDLEGLIRKLSSEKPDSPFYLHLRESTKESFHKPLGVQAKEALGEAIINDLNGMIEDTNFLSNFLTSGSTFKEGLHFTKIEREYVNLLFKYLKEEDKVLNNAGALDIGNRNITLKHPFLMKIINTVIVVQEFRQYLYNSKPAPYLPGGYGNSQNGLAIKELSLAGYSLKHEYDFIPFNIILIFASNERTKENR